MTELEQLTAQIKQATDYQTNKQILREKTQTDLHFTYNGGLFKADLATYEFVTTWQGDVNNLYLEDTYGNPIKIDIREFVTLATQHYSMVMNAWHIQHEELKRARKV